MDLPRRLQIEFSGVVQHDVDQDGGEVTPAELWAKFEDEYPRPRTTRGAGSGSPRPGSTRRRMARRTVVGLRDRSVPGTEVTTVEGHGNGPIAAFVDALAQFDVDVRVLDYAEHAMSAGGDAKAAAYVECAVGERVLWGVGSTPRSSAPRSRRSSPRSTGRCVLPRCAADPDGPPGHPSWGRAGGHPPWWSPRRRRG